MMGSQRYRQVAAMVTAATVGCLCGVGCCATLAHEAIASYTLGLAENRVYREELGIGGTDGEVQAFLTEKLGGMTHAQAVAQLREWGEVEEGEDCLAEEPFEMCEVTVRRFLGTSSAYRLSMFYEDGRLTSTRIEWS